MFDLCVSKGITFFNIQIKVNNCDIEKSLLKKRIDNGNCRFTTNIELADADVSNILDTLKISIIMTQQDAY